VPALALARHTPALAGELSAIAAAGDLAGGVIYGGRSWSLPLRACLVAALLALAASCAALGAVLSCWDRPVGFGDIAAAAVGMAFFGAAEAVTGITVTALIQHVAPPDARTESYAIIISAALAGAAAGNLAGGGLAGSGLAGVRLVFLAAASGAVAAATWAASRKDTL